MTRAVILSEHDLSDWKRRHETGDAPAPLPYGVNALEHVGFSLVGAQQAATALATKVRRVVEHRSGMTVERPLRAAPAVRRADVVLALLEREALLPGLLKARGVPPYRSTPLVVWSCWLADDIARATSERRRWLRQRLASADLITHLSRHETDILTDFGVPRERLFPVTYGVSHEFYSPDSSVTRDIAVLAVGQDRGRDYATLVDAVRDTDLVLDVVCKPENLAGLDLPRNVRVHGTVPLAAYRALLRRAQVVAVPTREMAYPTGSSVALEAASSGCAVVVTGTRAMRDYFAQDVNAHLVDEGDVEGWRTALTTLRHDRERRERLGREARDRVVRRFNAHHMWTELAEVMAQRGLTVRPEP